MMKSIGILFAFLLCIASSIANAQELNYEAVLGTWEYQSPKKKSKLSYRFDVDKKFTSITERNENEVKTDGSYEFDKKGGLDRLKLMIVDNGNSTRTQMSYHLIRLVGTDTLKIQSVNDKQAIWLPENRRNTITFVKKKEKPKNK